MRMRRSLGLLLVFVLIVLLAPPLRADNPDPSALLRSAQAWAAARPDALVTGYWEVTTDGARSAQTLVQEQSSGGDRLISTAPSPAQFTPQAAIKGGELYLPDAAGWRGAGAYPLTRWDAFGAGKPSPTAFDPLNLFEQALGIATAAELVGNDRVGDVDTVRIRIRPDAASLNDSFHRMIGGKRFDPATDAYMIDGASFSVWVDGGGAVRKVSFVLHLLASTPGAGGQETHDMSYLGAFLVEAGPQSINWPALPSPAPTPAPTPPAATGAIARYTVMVFQNGTDLESTKGALASNDLREMQIVGSTPAVNVVVETLGTGQWHTPGISNQTNQRWLVRQGGLELVQDNLGLRPVGDPATLTDFVVWAATHYPAERYALILWDHGGGPNGGFGHDELKTPSSLSLNDFQKAISDAAAQIGSKLELVGFDACLMAGVETAALLSPYARYLVASEELEPGHGWWYTHILKALNNDPTMGGDRVGRAIADGFRAQASSPVWGTAANTTLSVIDLSRVDAVVQKLEALVSTASGDVGDVGRLNPLLQARSKAEDYGAGQHPLDLVDLGDLAGGLAAPAGPAAPDLRPAVGAAGGYNLTSTGRPRATGLSVFFPYKNKLAMQGRVAAYGNLNFSQTYRQFIDRYAQTFSQDTTKVQFTQSQPSGDGKSREVKVDPAQAEEIDAIYSVTAKAKAGDPDTILFLSMDNDVEFDLDTGEVQDNITGQSVTLNGHFVSMFYEGDAGDYASYWIPIKLNGEDMDLQVLFSYDTGKSQIVGAWPGIDPEVNQPSKEIIKLKDGDRITPLFYYYNTVTDQDGFDPGPEFVLRGTPRLYWANVPAGEYLYGFYLVDIARNESFSDFSAVEFDDLPDASAIKVIVDDSELLLDVAPEIRSGRTLVPLRAIFEALDATVSWDDATRTVTAKQGDTTIVLQIDNPIAQVNGKPVRLDQAPVISGGRTLVPVRFVSEALGAQVMWDGDTRTVFIDSRP